MSARSLLLLLCGVCLNLRAAADEAPLPTFDFEHYLIAPLRVHLLVSESEPALCTTLTDADIERIFGKVNRVWRQAGIAFLVESIVREKPEPDEAPEGVLPGDETWLPRHVLPANYSTARFNVYYLKQFGVNGIAYPKAVFVKDTASLRRVEGGIDEPIPRVTSHEIGHQLSLQHRQDTYNLMASGTTGTSLNAVEIEAARQRAESMGRFRIAADWVAEAAELRTKGKAAEAAEMERKLAALPMESTEFEELRKRVAGPE